MILGISTSECDPPGVTMVGTTVMAFTPSLMSFSTAWGTSGAQNPVVEVELRDALRASHVHVQVGLIEIEVEIRQPLTGNPRILDFFLDGVEFFEVSVFQNHDKPGGGPEF